jgi:hypothetical protein
MKVNPDLVHAWLKLKRMRAPGPQINVTVNHNSRRAGVQKKREWKKARFNLNSGPGLLLGGHQLFSFA